MSVSSDECVRVGMSGLKFLWVGFIILGIECASMVIINKNYSSNLMRYVKL